MRTPLLALTAALAILIACPAPTYAASQACDSKRADIQASIDAAKAQGQTRALRGLEKALREVQDHCSDAALEQAHARRIAKQEKKVAERRSALQQARAQGKAQKIAEREAKLAEEIAELEQLRAGTR